MTPAPANVDTSDVVIVGGGPRAVSVVERLAARVSAEEPPVRVAVVDAVEVGAGATWRTDQSPLLLNNTYAGQTTIYPDEATRLSGPLRCGPDMFAWAAEPPPPNRPSWVAGDLAELKPWSYPSRRVLGMYYREQLARVLAKGSVSLREYVGVATELVADGKLRVVRLADGRAIAAPMVVLAQGMVQAVRTSATETFVAAARTYGLTYVEPGMPAERDWDVVPAGEPTLLAGLGANFFDVLALLTTGRGGRFEPMDRHPRAPRLRYRPSGREPRMLVGCRRGLPYRGKTAYPDGFSPRYRPTLATPEWFAEVAGKPLQDFTVAIWPQLVREFAWAHLRTLLEHRPECVRPGLSADSVLRDLRGAGAEEVEAIVADAIADPRWRFRVDRLDRPMPDHVFGLGEWDDWVRAYIAEERETIQDPLRHPRDTVNRAMAAVRWPTRRLVAAGAIDGRSAVADVDGWFYALGQALASGPPPERSVQLHALIEAGVVELLGEGTTITVEDGRFVGRASGVDRPPVYAEAFVETRMSKGKVDTTNDPLLRGLLETGRARLHSWPNRDGTRSRDTSLAVTTDGFALVNADGVPDHQVVVLGIPAEGVQPGSAIGAIPGVHSPLVAGADLAAEQILARFERAGGTTALPGGGAVTTDR